MAGIDFNELKAPRFTPSKERRRNLGVHDSEFQTIDRGQMLRDATKMVVDDQIRRDVEDACYVGDKNTSVANVDRQLGKPMHGRQFKKLVEELNPRLRVEKHPFYETWAVFELRAGQTTTSQLLPQKVYIGSVGGFTMKILPEWSIMNTRRLQVPGTERHAPVPKTVKLPDEMEARGWRGMLALLVSARLITKPAADRIATKYGSEARPSWQAYTGESNRKDFLS